jgi:predicted nuclease of predicted toxin-antitoxin system
VRNGRATVAEAAGAVIVTKDKDFATRRIVRVE